MRNRIMSRSIKKTKKLTTIILVTIFGFIILISFGLNALAKKEDYNILSISAPGPAIDSSEGHFRATTWDTTYATQAEMEDYLEVLEDAYDILVGDWDFPDPMGNTGQPPIELTLENVTGEYNGWACCPGSDQDFTTGIYPDYITQGFPADHEPLKVAGHEFFHICQYTPPGQAANKWVREGHARMIQDKLSDWLDHADGTEAGSSFVRQTQGYLGGSHTSDITTISYSSCLFWQYYCEQFGSDHTDPDYGVDAITTYWSSAANPSGSDGITMLNNALDILSPGTSFADVFADFSVAIYAKDLNDATTPSKWRFIDDDEIDGSGNYGTVSKEIDPIPTLTSGSPINDPVETVVSWSNKYYEVDIDPSVNVITVEFDQASTNNLFYTLLAMDGNDLEYSYNVEAQDFNRAIVNNNYDRVVVIVAGLENSVSDTATFSYSFEAGDPDIFILSPQDSPVTAQARVGPHDTPEKFVAIVDTYYREKAPVHGFFTENFLAQVGGINATVLAAVDVYGKYFLQIQAPNQSTDGLYDLKVELIDADTNIIDSATELDCVNYGDTYYDLMLNIDKSGSMADGDKIVAAKSAAKLLVDSFLSNDQLGVVAFDSDATLMHELMLLTSTNRETAYNKIDGISSGGATSIGDGLFICQNQLFDKGIGDYPDHIIVLSDGKENRDRRITDVLPLLLGNGTIVHVITIGELPIEWDDAYEAMQGLAGDTGGTFFYCFDPSSGDISNDLAELYRAITETIRPMERFYHARGNINPSNNKEFKLRVTDDMDLVEFVVHYNASTKPTSVELKDPDGSPVVWDYEDDKSGMGRAVYRKSNPKVGEWTIKITFGASSSELQYFVEGAAHTYLTMTLLTPPNGFVSAGWGNCEPIGSRIPVLVSLTDQKSIKNAEVYMNVIPPGFKSHGTEFRIPLYDDGNHGDSLPGDGIYGNIYTATSEEGTYQFTINATGEGNNGRAFTRIKTGAFYCYQYEWRNEKERILRVPDTDGDGLPDHWEEFYGLKPDDDTGEHGAGGDPDLDWLDNIDEFFHGTDPTNSDSDYGGQGDHSEVYFGLNPLDPKDDIVEKFPYVSIFPGNNSTLILFPNISLVKYNNLYIYRSKDPNFGYSIIYGSSYRNSFNDTAVSNYETYYYRFLADYNHFNETSISKSYKAIPKECVIPAEACVIINNGNKNTITNLVNISIAISKNDDNPKNALPPTHMRIGQNVSALMSALWIPYNPQFPMLLTSEKGVKFVFVQLRDDQIVPEISPIFSDGIYYTGEEEVKIGLETTFTVFIIFVDFIVATVIFYERKKKHMNIKKF